MKEQLASGSRQGIYGHTHIVLFIVSQGDPPRLLPRSDLDISVDTEKESEGHWKCQQLNILS